MSILSDKWIIEEAESRGLLTPFEPAQVREAEGRRVISYGTSSYGYDLRLAGDDFRVFSPIRGREIDPKDFDMECLIPAPVRTAKDGSEYFLMPPHTYALGVSVETIRMPRDVSAIVGGKSSLARCGLSLNCTLVEPTWCGRLVLELSNQADLPLRVYINEGVAQCLFIQGNEPCLVAYAERPGGSKYQNQTGLTVARL